MDIWTVLRACARRWYVFVPVLGLSLWIGSAQMQAADPVYTATSTAALAGPALVPGNEPGESIRVNPFESLGGSLNTTTDVMVSLMDSDPKRLEFADQGVALDYEVVTANAVIYFEVTGPDAQVVTTTAVRLVEILDNEISALQSKPVEAPESRIRAVPLALPSVADEDTTGGIRLLAVIGALGLVLSVAAALVVDGALQVRERRAASRPLVLDPDGAETSWAGPHAGNRAAGDLTTEPSDDTTEPSDDSTDDGRSDDSSDTLATEVVGQAGHSGRGA